MAKGDYPEALSDAMALGEVYRKRIRGEWVCLRVHPVICADILKAWGSVRVPRGPHDMERSEDGWMLRPERLFLMIQKRIAA